MLDQISFKDCLMVKENKLQLKMKIKEYAILFCFFLYHSLCFSQENSVFVCDLESDTYIYNSENNTDTPKWMPFSNFGYIKSDSIMVRVMIFNSASMFNNKKISKHSLESSIVLKMGLSRNCVNSVNPIYSTEYQLVKADVVQEDFTKTKSLAPVIFTVSFPLKSRVNEFVKEYKYYNLNQIIVKTKITDLSNNKECLFEYCHPICLDLTHKY